MNRLNKLALGVALAAGASVAAAGTITGTNQTVGSEFSAGGFDNESAGEIVISLANGTRASDELTITIAGADFSAGQTFALFASDAAQANFAGLSDDDDWTFFSATSNVITFIASGNIPQAADNIFYLAGDTGAAGVGVDVNLDQGAEGTTVTVAADHTGDDTFAAGATLFTYADEFSGEASGAFSAVIDAVNAGRLAFVGAASDAVGIDFDLAAVDVAGTLDDDDTVTVTLFGDMTGIGAVTFVDADGDEYEAVISTDSATVVASGADLFTAGLEPQ